jgi:hypothetical protein
MKEEQNEIITKKPTMDFFFKFLEGGGEGHMGFFKFLFLLGQRRRREKVVEIFLRIHFILF